MEVVSASPMGWDGHSRLPRAGMGTAGCPDLGGAQQAALTWDGHSRLPWAGMVTAGCPGLGRALHAPLPWAGHSRLPVRVRARFSDVGADPEPAARGQRCQRRLGQRGQTPECRQLCPGPTPQHGDICCGWKRGCSSWELHFHLHSSQVTGSRGKRLFLNVRKAAVTSVRLLRLCLLQRRIKNW